MTALDEVLTAEKEAEQTVATAKENAAAAIVAAKTKQTEDIAAEEAKLAEAAAAATETEEKRVEELAKQITAQVDNEVSAIEQGFGSQKDALTATVKEHFS